MKENKSRVFLALAAALALGCSGGKAYANNLFYADFHTKYPAAVGSRIDACSLCHSAAPALNAFGADFRDFGFSLAAVEGRDSDGDKYVNVDEIVALTFPGNIADFPAIPAWRIGETDLGGGWRSLSWLGNYNVNYDPWIYHQEHGFLYAVPGSSVYFWDSRIQQFWWTASNAYPYLYRFGPGASWFWYQKGSANPRRLYNWTTGLWESWDQTCTYTYSAWGACQPNNTQTRTLLTSSPPGCSGTPVLSQGCAYVPPACGSCHTIPPATGKHVFHSTRATCATCHGSGYSNTTVNATTHNNGVKNVVSTLSWNASTRTCGSPGCHGSRIW